MEVLKMNKGIKTVEELRKSEKSNTIARHQSAMEHYQSIYASLDEEMDMLKERIRIVEQHINIEEDHLNSNIKDYNNEILKGLKAYQPNTIEKITALNTDKEMFEIQFNKGTTQTDEKEAFEHYSKQGYNFDIVDSNQYTIWVILV